MIDCLFRRLVRFRFVFGCWMTDQKTDLNPNVKSSGGSGSGSGSGGGGGVVVAAGGATSSAAAAATVVVMKGVLPQSWSSSDSESECDGWAGNGWGCNDCDDYQHARSVCLRRDSDPTIQRIGRDVCIAVHPLLERFSKPNASSNSYRSSRTMKTLRYSG